MASAGGLRVVRGEEDLAAQHQALQRNIYHKLICSLSGFVGNCLSQLRKGQLFRVSFLTDIILAM